MEDVVQELDGKIEPVTEEEDKVDVNTVEEAVEEPNEDNVTSQEAEEAQEVSEEPQETAEVKEEPVVQEISNEYVDSTLAEVDEYNKQDGRKTVDDISNSIIDEIRHGDEKNDKEFSDTVSLEIDKVLSEIGASAAPVNVENVLNDTVKPIEVNPEEFASKMADTIKHPVLAKVQGEEPVEIKSLDETLRQDVVDDTIPFVMNDNITEQEEIEEYYDDEKPNKVLNVILVILIVILLAILGVIAYYILYAKGIIK